MAPIDKSMILDCVAHFSPTFKISIQANKLPLNLQRAILLDYSTQHPTEVWVKHGEEDWSNFELEKCQTMIRSLPSTQKYASTLPVKQSKVTDLRKLVQKYVPAEHHSFYDALKGDKDVS